MDGLAPATLPTLERGDGAAEIGFALSGGATRLSHLYQRAPSRVLSPSVETGEPTQAVVVTTSGGLADGDRLRLAIDAGTGTAVQVATQAAEKVYRAQSTQPARVDCTISVGPGAWLEWLPQETIMFDRARLEHRTRADVAPGARLLACEHVVFGRIARGENFADGYLFDRWDVMQGGTLKWCDAIEVSGETDAARAAPWGFAGAQAFATAIYVADDAPAHIATAREIIASTTDAKAGATVVNGILIARWLGTASGVRAGLLHFITGFRAAAGGYRATPPRVWTI